MVGMPDAPDPIARVSGLFDALSATYDAVGVDFFGPIAEGLLAAMPPRSGERWLDVGCGRGAVTLPVARAVGASGRVTGIDISAGMVDQARRLAAEQGIENVDLAVGDARDPQLDGPFDAIASSLVLFFLPDPAAALRSWLRLLAPSGRLGVATFGSMDERWEHVDDVLTPFLPQQQLDARTSGKAGPFGSDAGMEHLVSDAGYIDVRTVTLDLPVRFADAAQWYDFSWSVAQRGFWLAVPEQQRPDVRAEAERRIASYADADGSVTFTQSVRYTLGARPS